IDSVAMKGCTLKYWISTPEIAPNTVPEKIIRKITKDGDSPALASITPETLENAMIDHTERSIPPLPVRIGKVTPTAMMIRCELLINRFDSVLNWTIRP